MLIRFTTLTSAIALVLLITSATSVYAGFCAQWDAAKTVGSLTSKDVREASGLTASRAYPNRVYWINDSGDKGYFYYSDSDGRNLNKVKIADFKPRDTEALSLTDCDEGSCLAIADIGDNKAKRKDIQIVFVPEQQSYSGPVKTLRRLTLEYPDGARNAEAMAFLPSGEMIIVTKELRLTKLASAPAGVYGLSKAEWNSGAKKLKLKKLGELPLPAWLPEEFFFSQLVTDMAVNTKRQVLGLLTYTKAVEVPLSKLTDLTQVDDWKKDRDFTIVPIEALSQQESMTYLSEPDRILWSSEARVLETPIFSMTCTRSVP